jgi:hypothetical protein
MSRARPIYTLAILSLLMAGCDPMRRIQMKNMGSEDAEVTWLIKMDSIHVSPLYLSSDREVRFRLAPRPSKAVNLSCGVGTWTPRALNDLTDDLDSLVIRWGERELAISGPDSIRAFLHPRRAGLGKDKIRIHLRDPG